MFGKVFRMEFKRSFSIKKALISVSIVVCIFLMSVWNDFGLGGVVSAFPKKSIYIGSGDMLLSLLVTNRYTVLVVIVLGWMHAGSFAKDDTYQYLRAILCRTDITTYTQCRFLSHILSVCLGSILSFYVFVILMMPYMDIFMKDNVWSSNPYYAQLALDRPAAFIGMMGLQFGILAAAFTSIGIVYSVYQPNYFVSIAIGGLTFYAATSFLPTFFTGKRIGAFDIWGLMMMDPVLGNELPWAVNYMWGIMFPLTIVLICGYLFYRRMQWRVANGYI